MTSEAVRASVDGKEATLPESSVAGVDPDLPLSPPTLRWVLKLECGHAVLSDEEELELRAYCPGCGLTLPVVGTYVHRDEDIA